MAQLVGFLFGIAIVSAISAVITKLTVKLVTRKNTGFGRPFLIAFISFAASLLVQRFFYNVRPHNSLIDALPVFVFFLACWVLNALFIKFTEDGENLGFLKSLLVTLIQCVSLFIIGTIFSLVLIAVLIR